MRQTLPSTLRRARALRILVVLTAMTLSIGCTHDSGKERSAPKKKPPRSGIVIFKPPGRTVRVAVEIVSDPDGRARGLMYRRKLAPMAGMLFIFEHQETHSFWMKNTYIPLDMVFVNEAGKVAGIVENAAPLTTESRSVDAPSRYVVELNAGFCKSHGISDGTSVVLPPKANH